MGGCCVRENSQGEFSFSAAKKQSTKESGGAENHQTENRKPKLKRSATQLTSAQTPKTPTSQDKSFSRLTSLKWKETTLADPADIPAFSVPTKKLSVPLCDKYPIISTLSRTTLGEFVLVEHSQAKMLRVVRMFRRNQSDTWREDQFRTELDTLRKLDHPHVLHFTEVLYDSKRIYAISEPIAAVRNMTFDDVAAMRSEPIVATLAAQMLQTMCYCHSNGVSHGGLNAMNVFIFDNGTEIFDVKVTGFGGRQTTEFFNDVRNPNLYTAPELFEGNCGPKADVWGCGVLLHLLTCRELPYRTSTKDEFLSIIGNYPPVFTQAQWGKVSPKLKTLVKGMLRRDVEWRLSIEQCLQDDWVVETSSSLSTQAKATVDALTNMKLFTGSEQLTMSMMSFVVQHILTSDERRSLMAVFHCIDNDKDGTLNHSDLKQAYAGTLPKDVAELLASRVLECVDIDRNGSIDFSEFVLAATERRTLLSSKSLRLVFKSLDEDGNGSISLSELKSALKSKASESTWNKLMQEIDENGDGEISFDEFVKLVKKTTISVKGRK